MKLRYAVNELLILFMLMAIFGTIAIIWGQDGSWDFKNYHWYNAYSFLNSRFERDFLPAQVQTLFNPLLDTINYLIIKYTVNPKISEFVIGSLHGIAVYFLLNIAHVIFKDYLPSIRWFYVSSAALIGATGVANYSQTGMMFNEIYTTILIMAAILIIIRANYESYWLYIISGFMFGLAFGLKLTAAPYAVAFFFALFLYKKPNKHSFYWCFLAFLSCAIGFLIVNGFWMNFLYKNFHNPFFPFYNNIFHSPYVPYTDFSDRRYISYNFFKTLFLPFYWFRTNGTVQEAGMADPRVAMTFLLGFVFLINFGFKKFFNEKLINFYANHNEKSINFIFIFYFISYVIWLVRFSIYRYAIPINLLTGVIIVYFCSKIFKSDKSRIIAITILSILILLDTKQSDWGRINYGESFFQVETPALPKNAMILLVSDEPLSYLISEFPSDSCFIGFNNNMITLSHPVLLKLAIDRISSHFGPLYAILSTDSYISSANSLLNKYGFEILKSNCGYFKSSLEKHKLMLCTVKKEK